MPTAAQKPMSLDEFLAWEREQPERHEFDGFTIVAMTGASLPHVVMTMNIAFALREALRGTGCRPFANDAKVLAGNSVRYPDISVTCRPYQDSDDIVPDPIVIIEVVSLTTERTDRGRKKFEYFAIPSLRHYATFEQDERLIDLYTRTEAGWVNEIVAETGVLSLSSLGVELPLDVIYEDTELDATRRPADGESAPAG
jgi:Uma2 family endonuclease